MQYELWKRWSSRRSRLSRPLSRGRRPPPPARDALLDCRSVTRNARLALLALSAFLLVFPLTLPKPGLPVNLKADEPAYYLMALSLARDGDLRVEVKDIDRLFEEFPLVPVRNLIVMSDDGWNTVYYSKPIVYPLLAAPFAALFGANGMLLLNMAMVVAMIWMGAYHLRRYNSDGLAVLLASCFVLLSSGFAYAYWLHTETFNMTAVAASCFLLFRCRDREAGLIWPALSGMALALAAANKPMYAMLLAPLWLLAWRKWHWRGLLSWGSGAALVLVGTMALSTALIGKPSPYLGSQKRAGISVCEPGKMPLQPVPATVTGTDGGNGVESEEDAVVEPPPLNWGFVLLPPRLDFRELGENLGYFLWGRHTGFMLYLPFGALCILVLALEAPRDPVRWLLLGTLAAIAAYFLVMIPVNWQGGGGFIGNRYYVAVYPAFLYLVRSFRPAALFVPTVAAAGAFLGPLLLMPFGASMPSPTLQAHVRNAPFRFFQLELSLKNLPGYHRVRLDGVRLLARRDQIVPRGEAMWIRGSDRVEFWVEMGEPAERLAFVVDNLAGANVVDLELGGARESLEFAAEGESRRVVLEPGRADRRRSRGEQKSWAYKLVVRSKSGSIKSWERRLGRGCGDFENDPSRRESFYAGVQVRFLGDGDKLARDVYAVEWGPSPVVSGPVMPGSRFSLPVKLTNRSEHPWQSDASARIRLSYHWLDAEGETVVFDGLRSDLDGVVAPGAAVDMLQEIEAPAAPGAYILELDPVLEDVAWFSTRNGGNTLRLAVEVLEPEPGEG